MATAKEREEFIGMFCAQYPKRPAHETVAAARSLLRLARTHGNLAVQHCNGPQHLNGMAPYDWKTEPDKHAAWIKRNREQMGAWEAAREKKEEACEQRIRDICAGFKLPVILGGDPRGYTVKVKFPSGRYNTWGGADEGWGGAAMKTQKCKFCPLPSLPGLIRTQGHCAYHWAARNWGTAWAARCQPEHPEAQAYARGQRTSTAPQ